MFWYYIFHSKFMFQNFQISRHSTVSKQTRREIEWNIVQSLGKLAAVLEGLESHISAYSYKSLLTSALNRDYTTVSTFSSLLKHRKQLHCSKLVPFFTSFSIAKEDHLLLTSSCTGRYIWLFTALIQHLLLNSPSTPLLTQLQESCQAEKV